MLREHWRSLTAFGASVVACSVVASLFANGPLQSGFILGIGVTIALGASAALVILASGTAPLMTGEMAEQWTAQGLRPLSEHGWKLVNHFELGFGNLDHVLVVARWRPTGGDQVGRDAVGPRRS